MRGHAPTAAAILVFLALVPALLPAQTHGGAEASGQNTPGRHTWLYTETDHFRFVYQPEDSRWVEELVEVADDVYRRVAAALTGLPDLVTAVVFGRTDAANGYFTSAPPAHIGLFVASPSGYWLGARTASWLETLLLHELVHYVQLLWPGGFFSELSRVFGEGVAAGLSGFYPGWAIEGPAVFLETALAEGGRGRNPFFEMYARALVYDGDFPDYRQSGFGSWDTPPGRIYLAGYLFVDYLQRTYGPQALIRAQQILADNPLLGLDTVLEQVLGTPPQVAYDAMVEDLERELSAGRSSGRRISPEVRSDYHLPISTAAGLVLYRSRTDRPPAIVLLPGGGDDEDFAAEQVLVETGLSDPNSFHADPLGRRLVFTAFGRPAGEADAVYSYLYLAESESGGASVDPVGPMRVRRVSDESGFFHPVISPGGETIYALKRRGIYRDLVAVDVRSGVTRTLVSPEDRTFYHPTLSPGGDSIVLVGNREGTQTLYRVVLSEPSPTLRPLDLPDLGATYYPRFVTEDRLLFSADGTGRLVLYSLDMRSGDVRIQARDPVSAFAGTLHRGQLIYAGYRSDGYALFEAADDPQGVEIDPGPAAPGRLEAPPGRLEAPPHQAQAGPDESIQPFSDLPLPRIWAPFPTLLQLGDRPADLRLGAGLFSLGSALLSPSGYSLLAAFYPTPGQPTLDLALSLGTDATTIAYRLTQDFGRAGSRFHQTTSNSLTVSAVLAGSARIGVSDALSLAGSARHTYIRLTAGEGAFFAPAPDAVDAHFADFGLRLRYASARPAAARNIFSPGSGAASAGASASVPLGTEGWTVTPELNLSATVDGFFGVDALRLSLAGEYSFGPLPLRRRFQPRGFSDLVKQTAGGILGAFDYLFSFEPIDAPVTGALGLLGLGAGLHLTALANWDATSVAMYPRVYTGLDLVGVFAVMGAQFPVGVGTSLELDPLYAGILRGFSLYFFTGTNSYTGVDGALTLRR